MINKWNNNKVSAIHEYLLESLFHTEVIDFALWCDGGDRFEEVMLLKVVLNVACKK
jgi:hypothetical protein